ncbi:hypothetical protein MMC11_008455 [Xylographa trunciseda]|nr:hypothetical protein [Xylographa trunciseda]
MATTKLRRLKKARGIATLKRLAVSNAVTPKDKTREKSKVVSIVMPSVHPFLNEDLEYSQTTVLPIFRFGEHDIDAIDEKSKTGETFLRWKAKALYLINHTLKDEEIIAATIPSTIKINSKDYLTFRTRRHRQSENFQYHILKVIADGVFSSLLTIGAGEEWWNALSVSKRTAIWNFLFDMDPVQVLSAIFKIIDEVLNLRGLFSEKTQYCQSWIEYFRWVFVETCEIVFNHKDDWTLKGKVNPAATTAWIELSDATIIKNITMNVNDVPSYRLIRRAAPR